MQYEWHQNAKGSWIARLDVPWRDYKTSCTVYYSRIKNSGSWQIYYGSKRILAYDIFATADQAKRACEEYHQAYIKERKTDEENKKSWEDYKAETWRRVHEEYARRQQKQRGSNSYGRSRTYTSSATNSQSVLAYFGEPIVKTISELKTRYRKLALQHHPDQGGSAIEFKKLQDNFEGALRCLE